MCRVREGLLYVNEFVILLLPLSNIIVFQYYHKDCLSSPPTKLVDQTFVCDNCTKETSILPKLTCASGDRCSCKKTDWTLDSVCGNCGEKMHSYAHCGVSMKSVLEKVDRKEGLCFSPLVLSSLGKHNYVKNKKDMGICYQCEEGILQRLSENKKTADAGGDKSKGEYICVSLYKRNFSMSLTRTSAKNTHQTNRLLCPITDVLLRETVNSKRKIVHWMLCVTIAMAKCTPMVIAVCQLQK